MKTSCATATIEGRQKSEGTKTSASMEFVALKRSAEMKKQEKDAITRSAAAHGAATDDFLICRKMK